MLVWAIYTLRLQDRPQSLSLFAFVFVMALIGELLTLPFAALQWVQAGGVHLGAHALLGLFYIGALATLVSTALFSYGVERVGAVRAGILIHLMPVFSSVFATLFIGERLFLYHAAGFVLVAGGAIVGCLRPEPVLSSQAYQKNLACETKRGDRSPRAPVNQAPDSSSVRRSWKLAKRRRKSWRITAEAVSSPRA